MKKFHYLVVLQALFVTFLWSTSWILIKKGLQHMPALTFAGMRYTIAFVILLTWVILTKKIHLLKKLTRSQIVKLFLLGIFLYMLTQGAQFLGLLYLPAVQVSLFLNFTPVIVMLFAYTFLGEGLKIHQLYGMIIFIIGTLLYFYPIIFYGNQALGFVVMIIGVVSNAISSLLGRSLNKMKTIDPLIITTVSMGVGGVLLLSTGLVVQGFSSLTINNWLIILWLAIVNTAFAFYLWNKTLQTLTATESSVINNTMLVQITVLAWLFMRESLDIKDIIGVILAAIGAILVQIKFRNKTVIPALSHDNLTEKQKD